MTKLVKMLMCALLLCTQLMAQNRTVTGKVTDDKGVPVANASVVAKGSRQGTTTNAEGNFSLSVPGSVSVLTVSSVNFAAQDVVISANNTVSVTLASSTALLDEVVVVGYSTSTKQAFTGSAKQVSNEQLNKKNVSNVSQALAGEVAGVRVINTSGQPGTSATIRIRGIGSVNGNRSPLYVVDGVPFNGSINGINTADVASMTVLKDAAATAIYGSRGANGVIVITTNSGKGKQPYIEVDGKFGSNMSLLPRYQTIKSPEAYIGLQWEAMYNLGAASGVANPTAFANNNLFNAASANNIAGGVAVGITPFYNMWNVATVADLIDPVTRTVKPGVTRKYDPENWEDYAFQSSNRVETNIRMGGGDGRTNYYTSVGYLKDKGYSINSDFTRLSFRVNLNHEVKPWLTTAFNANYSNAITNNNGQGSSSNSVFWFVDNLPSIYPLFLRDATGNKVADPIFGGYQYDYGAGTGKARGFGGLTNAIADATYNTSRSTRHDLTGNASIKIKFSRDLTLENRLGMQYYGNLGVSRGNKFYGGSAPQNGSIFQTRTDLMNLNLLTMLRYARRFGGAHNLEVLAAHEATNYKQSILGAGGNNLVDNYGLELDNAIVKVNSATTSYSNTNKLESYFTQVNYDYAGKYYLAATVRADGSSRFIKGNTWGTFGSLGLGWEVTKENFMKKGGLLSYLKLKASYGILGDQDGFGLYPGVNQISINNLNDLPSFGVPVPGNPSLTWEQSKMFQVGAEFRLGSFLDGSVDYYIKNTDNMLFNRSVGISNGYASIQVNDGQLRNTGVEFELTGHIIKKRDFYLDLNVNGEHFKNTITKMPFDPSIQGPKLLDIQGLYGYGKGHSLYDYYTRQSAGVDPATGVAQWTVYYDDLNNNNAFDAGEQIASLEQFKNDNPAKATTYKQGITKTFSQATLFYTGQSALPKLRGAINLNAGFKNFDVSVQFLYSLGGYAYDALYQGLMASGSQVGGNNFHTDIFRRWQKAGDITDVPRLTSNLDVQPNGTSTRFLAKADYLSLNNVRVGYTLPAKTAQALGIQQATFYVSGDNLFLASARKGLNPSVAETGASNTYTYSPLSTVSAGVKVRF